NSVSPDVSKAAEQIQLARQFQIKGENETAIECYNKALDLDADNVEALNGLAWILSTADNPAMRNGNKAVDLAMKAAKLSKWRQPTVIETLSVAYANADQYSNALIMAQAANELAILTGRSDIAARTAKLQNFYRIRAAARPVGQ
ncbi:MAG TPA: tetratricopeptide repeat protein, partial [Verrucomicrobiae bacterium]|nr:tetratricopeptide repeat protein [Verrucomicrobiae bacterium]